MEEFKMFDIVYVDLNTSKIGSEQSGIRPCVIIQNNTGNKYSPTLLVMCLTSSIKKRELPTHCIIRKSALNGLKCDSMVMAETLCQVSKARILSKVGYIDNERDKNNIISAYLANITGRKTYSSGISELVYAICRFVVRPDKTKSRRDEEEDRRCKCVG